MNAQRLIYGLAITILIVAVSASLASPWPRSVASNAEAAVPRAEVEQLPGPGETLEVNVVGSDGKLLTDEHGEPVTVILDGNPDAVQPIYARDGDRAAQEALAKVRVDLPFAPEGASEDQLRERGIAVPGASNRPSEWP